MASNDDKINRRGLQTSNVSTVIGISLVLFMIGIVAAGILGVKRIQTNARESLEVDLFISTTANEADVKQMEQALSSWPEIKEVEFISSIRALEALGEDASSINEMKTLYADEDAIQASILFRPKSEYASIAALKKLSAKLKAEYGELISEVNYNESSVDNVNLGFEKFVYLVLLVAALLSVIAFAMINNTIRLSLYSKRFSIKTMQLVGATNKFIRFPFIRNAVLQGIFSAIIGMALLLGLFVIMRTMSDVFELAFEPITFLILFGIILIVGVFISVVSTIIALNRFLRTKLDDLY